MSVSDAAPTLQADGLQARFAYRRFGTGDGVPLVLCMRFRGTMDHWDPALLDVLASERDVIVFDNRGTGMSSGKPPTSIEELGEGAFEFVDAIGLTEVDVFGWSLGGYCRSSPHAEASRAGPPPRGRRKRPRRRTRSAQGTRQGLTDRTTSRKRRRGLPLPLLS